MASYELDGPKWGNPAYGTASGQIYWSFAEYNWTNSHYSFDAIISDPTYRQLIRDAFALWEKVANVDFVEIADSSSTMFRLGWDAIDGYSNTVGETYWTSVTYDGINYSIDSAEIRFDTAEDWVTGKNYVRGYTNFYAVAVHEIGHALGLGHTNDTAQIMYPYTSEQTTLGSGDIAGVQVLYGPAQTYVQYGTNGNDYFTLTSGDDNVQGYAGTDFVYFGVSGATISVSHSGTTIIARGQGTDTLQNVERLQFTNGVLAFDTDGVAGQGYRLYKAAFDRTPDTSGLGFWIKELDAGHGDLLWVARNFIGSAEFRSLYGAATSDEAFISLIYNNVLDRSPDNSGYAYWTNQMDNGLSREQLLASFSESAENQANVANAISDGIWYV